jgi:hypothetical protein
MALVDILKYVPASHPRRGELLTALSNLCIGIKNYQDPTSHLWFQVVDKTSATLAGNYIESSGSAMFIYTLRTAIDSGWISSATYMPVAQSAWAGIQAKITINADTYPQINDFAPAMSVQTNDAGYAGIASVDCPGSTNPHGYAAILMASAAMEFSSTLPVSFVSFTAKQAAVKTTLSWQMGDENDVDLYEIQKSANGTDFAVIGKTTATGLLSYQFDDNAAESKTVYYRINAVYKNGSAHYSVILVVKRNSTSQTFEISPNPVKGGDLNFVASNFKPGRYNVSVVSASGRIYYSSPLTITEGISGQHIHLPGTIAKGIYYVRLNGEGIVINKNVVIE